MMKQRSLSIVSEQKIRDTALVLFASHRWKFNNAHDALSPRPSAFGEREREHQTEAKLTQTCLFLFVQYVLLESV
jgi:hypothetical protein